MKRIFAVALLILAMSLSASAQTKVTATIPVNARTVSVAWVASTTPGVNYHVYRSLSTSGPFNVAATVAGTNYLDGTVVPGSTYVYQVTAFCLATGCPAGVSGESPPSPQVSVTIPNSPAAPSSVTVTVVVVVSK